MDFGAIATIQAVIWLIVGAAFLLVPARWVAPLGVTLGSEGVFVARLLGAAFLSLGVLDWVGREVTEAVAIRAIAYANITANAIQSALHVLDLVRGGVTNSRAWGLVILPAVLAVAWLVVALR